MPISEGLEGLIGGVLCGIGLVAMFAIATTLIFPVFYLLFAFKETIFPVAQTKINLKTYKEILKENPNFHHEIWYDFGIRKQYEEKVIREGKNGEKDISYESRYVNLTIPADLYHRHLLKEEEKDWQNSRYKKQIEKFKKGKKNGD